jgi:hypothetical protein
MGMMTRYDENFNLSFDDLLGGGVSDSHTIKKDTLDDVQAGDIVSRSLRPGGDYADLGRVSDDLLPTPPPPID